MNRCLKDKTLFLLHDGEGTSAQRSHLTECEACNARYRQLGGDLEAISQVLREEPPRETVSHRFRPLSVRWLPAAIAVAVAFLLVWEGVRMWNRSARPLFRETDNGEAWNLLDELPSSLFSLNEALAVELWTEGAGSYDLAAAALEADRPCEWYDLSARDEPEFSMDESEASGGTPLRSCVEPEAKPGGTKR
jgi:hypothetical protein